MQDDIKQIKTMLTAVVNSQSTMKSELLAKIEGVDKNLSSRIDNLESTMKSEFKKTNHRIDMLGKQLNV